MRCFILCFVLFLLLNPQIHAQAQWVCDGSESDRDILFAARSAYDNGDFSLAVSLIDTAGDLCSGSPQFTQFVQLRALIHAASAAPTPTLVPFSTPTFIPNFPVFTLINNSEHEICVLYLWSAMSGVRRSNWFREGERLLPGEERSWSVQPGFYDIEIDSCNGYQLVSLSDFNLEHSFTLDYPNEQLVALFRQIDSDGYVCRYAIARRDYVNALSFCESALSHARQGEYSLDEGIYLFRVGQVYLGLGLFSDAEDYFWQALRLQLSLNDSDGQADTINGLGDVAAAQGQYDLALERYGSIESMFEKQIPLFERTYANTLVDIAKILMRRGQFADALQYLDQAFARQQAIYNPLERAETLNTIGAVYLQLNDPQQALRLHQQAFELQNENEDLGGQTDTLLYLADAYTVIGDVEAASESYQLALDGMRAQSNRVGELQSLMRFGELSASDAVADYPAALTRLEAALLLSQDLGATAIEARILVDLGAVSRASNNLAQALSYLQDARCIAEQIGDLDTQLDALVELGAYYEATMNTDAEINTHEQAVTIIEQFHNNIRLQSRQLGFRSQDRFQRPYDRLVTLLIRTNPELAFEYSERSKAQTFLFQRLNRQIDFTGDAAVLSELETAREQSSALYEALYALPADADQARLEINQDIAEVQDAIARLEDQIAISSTRLQQWIAVQVPSLSSLLMTIPQDTALVSYHVTPDHIFAFVLTPTGMQAYTLQVTPAALKYQLQSFSADRFHNSDILHTLFVSLFDAIRSQIPAPHVIIAPHYGVNLVPFAALIDSQGEPVGATTAFSYVPSAAIFAVLVQSNYPELSAENTLIMGNPYTDPAWELASLRFAEVEASEIAALLDGNAVIGTQATETLFRQFVEGSDIVHLAVHGRYNAIYPLSSFLALAPDDQNDGLLETREIYGLSLRQHSPLVVLSACETAVGVERSGDEVQALSRAFLLDGAQGVIASLWPVDDSATAYLMMEFYQQWTSGRSIAESLAGAQSAIRLNAAHLEWASPHYWAGFVFIGVH